MARVKAEEYGRVIRQKSILFGDDHWGKIAYADPYPYTRNGQEFKKFLIVPSPTLVMAYPELRKRDVDWISTDVGHAIWREYPVYWINDKNNSITNPMVRIYCTFDGRETPETFRVKEYVSQIQTMQQEVDRLLIQVTILMQENEQLLESTLAKAMRYKEIQDIMKGEKVEKEDSEDE